MHLQICDTAGQQGRQGSPGVGSVVKSRFARQSAFHPAVPKFCCEVVAVDARRQCIADAANCLDNVLTRSRPAVCYPSRCSYPGALCSSVMRVRCFALSVTAADVAVVTAATLRHSRP